MNTKVTQHDYIILEAENWIELNACTFPEINNVSSELLLNLYSLKIHLSQITLNGFSAWFMFSQFDFPYESHIGHNTRDTPTKLKWETSDEDEVGSRG